MQAEPSRLRVVGSEAPEFEPSSYERDDGLPSPGAYIHQQRQRRGLSVEQLAVATKIPASSLRLLEDDRFEELPGPVFVKGFLRCCARALGVEADAVMELLYERERIALQARRRERSATGGQDGPVPVMAPKLPPRVRNRPAPDGGVVRQVLLGLPGSNALLWLMVAAFVAVLVMAAFNLVDAGPAVVSHS